jgi:YD repeat-containing protein
MNGYDLIYNGGVDAFVVKLLSTAPPAYTDEYTYDALGNLTSKAGTAYTYNAAVSGCAAGTPATKPHAVALAGSTTYIYDCNGNLTAGAGRIYTWDIENRPTSIQHTSGTESYTYDAEGERVTKFNGTVTTFYLGGLWEKDSSGATKAYYSFNGQVIALREASGVSYLHGDHLGSVSVAANWRLVGAR